VFIISSLYFTFKSNPKFNLNSITLDIVPDDFFDDDVEGEKEFLDMASSLIQQGDLGQLTSLTVRIGFRGIIY
jgi:hypothetical protein